MTSNHLQEYITRWYEENAPYGRLLGYPECCITAFCNQPPEVLQQTKATDADRMRYQAGHLNGEFTGFIPCAKCAALVLNGQITLSSLIQNRSTDLYPFPYQ